VWLALGALALIGGDSNETALRPELYRVPANLFTLDARDGTCRVKVLNPDESPRVLLTVDLSHGKALAEFRRVTVAGSLSCRFCAADLTAENRRPDPEADTLTDVCTEDDCVDAAQEVCLKRHACGHPCQGVRDEKVWVKSMQRNCGFVVVV
jgi:hypothetical protein